MSTKALKQADKKVEKVQAKLDKARKKQEALRDQHLELQGQKENLIQQLANEKTDHSTIDKHRESIQTLEDTIQVQNEVVQRLETELEAVKFEAYQVEQTAKAEWIRMWRGRFDQALAELEDLLAQTKLCQIETGDGDGGGLMFADRIRSLAFRVKPGQTDEQRPISKSLSYGDREQFKERISQEEREKSAMPPGSPRK